ncbi:nose resistant to fluoxetine protein 6 isoform X2 [Cylas formicarius]|uniref:nose resistant to fluoxetine protein 6 isoform X2 n=1 Tax=Cylas formicarius TaxID=197179 RepID=UPI002958C4A5|nr:nose resistant to fluoxetine protein 6 isoform X2 [Cylas formicarius]
MFKFSHFLTINFIHYVLANSVATPDKVPAVESFTTTESNYIPQTYSSDSDVNRTDVLFTSLSQVLNFYGTDILVTQWPIFKAEISPSCRKHLELYLEGLKKADQWALKMDDASGRYTTGWFWGNNYWTGSQSECNHIEPRSNGDIEIENRTRVARRAAVSVQKPSSPSQAVGYRTGPMVYNSAPPFPVSFFIMKIHLSSNFTSEEKILDFGLCLPRICTDEDVTKIVEKTSSASKNVEVEVVAIKSHYHNYNIWQDNTFIILCCTTIVIAFFLITGTSFDYYLEYQKKKNLMTSNLSPHLNGFNSPNGLILRELLLSFSIRANLKTICDQSVGSDTIPVIHGLKSISMLWVILGHTCIVAFKYSDNMEYRKVIQKDFMFQTISNGAFSVDTFFFTSGLLVSFLYFRTNAKGKLDPLSKGKNGFVAGCLHFAGLMMYRFARLTAPYLYTLGIVEVVMKWFNYNAVFEPPTNDHENCPKFWWRNLLYINTLFPVNEMCMLWSWYLSDDTQFYTVSAIMLIVATRHFKAAAWMLLVFMLSSWATTGYIAYSNSHMPGSDDPLALFDKIYDKPWTRFGPYLIGMCVGWYLFKKNCRIRMSKVVVVIGWILSIGCLISLVYGLYDVKLSPIIAAAYSSLSHSAWAFGLAWIVVACVTGYGGFVNKILSATILYPFSRVTYCAYLIHPIAIRVMVMSTDSPLHLGSFVTIVIFMGQVVVSYALSFVVSVAFEAPLVSMLRIFAKIVANRKKPCGMPT